MLVLTRKEGEQIIVGDKVRITIVRIAGNAVRIGVEADSDLPIHRGEVYEKIQRDQTATSEFTNRDNSLPAD
jgi:carbon storage regulator